MKLRLMLALMLLAACVHHTTEEKFASVYKSDLAQMEHDVSDLINYAQLKDLDAVKGQCEKLRTETDYFANVKVNQDYTNQNIRIKLLRIKENINTFTAACVASVDELNLQSMQAQTSNFETAIAYIRELKEAVND